MTSERLDKETVEFMRFLSLLSREDREEFFAALRLFKKIYLTTSPLDALKCASFDLKSMAGRGNDG